MQFINAWKTSPSGNTKHRKMFKYKYTICGMGNRRTFLLEFVVMTYMLSLSMMYFV